MLLDAHKVPQAVRKHLALKTDVLGNEYYETHGASNTNAGSMGNLSGKLHEDQTEYLLNQYRGHGKYDFVMRPKFKCHYGLPRTGDFKVYFSDREVHIECKQLGNCESHFDKLDHCMLNLIQGCYGYEFWLVIDYNEESLSRAGKKKIDALFKRYAVIKKQVALQGITFEVVKINDLDKFLLKNA